MSKKIEFLKVDVDAVAHEFKTSIVYVNKILSGDRIPTRGKGLKIKNFIDSLLNSEETEENNNQ